MTRVEVLTAPEGDADRHLEPPLDELVEHPDDAVELLDVEMLEQHATDEIAVAVGADREVRAVRRVVARQHEAVELLVVRGRVGQEVHLVTQRALVQIEVDRRGVASVATEAHVPTRDLRVVLDRLHPRLARDRALEMRGDQRRASRRGRPRRARRSRPSSSTSVAAHETSRDEIAVETAESRRGDAPRVACATGRRVRRPSRPRASRIVEQHRDRRGVCGRVATVDEEAGCAVVDERTQAADGGRDHGRPARGGLERNEPERLRTRRHDAHVGRR